MRGRQPRGGRCERPGEINLLGPMKGVKCVCRLSNDSGIPQGFASLRIKGSDRPPPTSALPASRAPPPSGRGRSSLSGLHSPSPSRPHPERLKKESFVLRQSWVKILALPPNCCVILGRRLALSGLIHQGGCISTRPGPAFPSHPI
jgi:hypothetical protein